jgi:hypothetical protein
LDITPIETIATIDITIKYIKVSIADIVTMVNKKTSKKREITSVQISKETKAELDKLIQNKGETYEDIIIRLIQKWKDS